MKWFFQRRTVLPDPYIALLVEIIQQLVAAHGRVPLAMVFGSSDMRNRSYPSIAELDQALSRLPDISLTRDNEKLYLTSLIDGMSRPTKVTEKDCELAVEEYKLSFQEALAKLERERNAGK